MDAQNFGCTEMILRDLREAHNRDWAASVYARAIRMNCEPDWPRVNAYIMERWSKSGLLYIKRKAWAT